MATCFISAFFTSLRVSGELYEARDEKVDVEISWDETARVEGEAVVDERGREPVEVLDQSLFAHIRSAAKVPDFSRALCRFNLKEKSFWKSNNNKRSFRGKIVLQPWAMDKRFL